MDKTLKDSSLWGTHSVAFVPVEERQAIMTRNGINTKNANVVQASWELAEAIHKHAAASPFAETHEIPTVRELTRIARIYIDLAEAAETVPADELEQHTREHAKADKLKQITKELRVVLEEANILRQKIKKLKERE